MQTHHATTGEPLAPSRARGHAAANDAPPTCALPGMRGDDVATSGPLKNLRYGNELASAAKKFGVPPTLVAAVAAQESGGPGSMNGDANAGRTNAAGRGLMQINPGAWPWAKTSAVWDPQKNAEFGAMILHENLVATGGNTTEALTMYNTGQAHAHTNLTQWPDGLKDYPTSVLRHQAQIEACEQHAK